MRLRPAAVVRLERALAHSWAPGLLAGACGTGCRSCVARRGAWVCGAGRVRARDPTGTGTPLRPSTNSTDPRYGPARRAVKPPGRHPAGRGRDRCRAGRTGQRRTAGPDPDRATRRAVETGCTCCGQPLAAAGPASLVSRGSPGLPHPSSAAAFPVTGRRGSGHTGATDVHRLWTTVWTATSSPSAHPGSAVLAADAPRGRVASRPQDERRRQQRRRGPGVPSTPGRDSA